MHSSNKVIKASSIRIARHQEYETTPESNARTGVGQPFLSDALGKQKLSPEQRGQCEYEEKVEGIRKKAYELGIVEGVKRGAAQQREEAVQLVNSLASLVSELTHARKEFLGSLEKEVLSLAFAVAEKILDHEISMDKEVICKVLGAALAKIADQEGMMIRLNPIDYQYLTEVNRNIFPGLEGIKALMLEADESIGQGGVVIVSALGEVDARLDQQMRTLKDALVGG
jgi:flagellar assembly protein FliH